MKIGTTSRDYSCQRNILWITDNDYGRINHLNINAYFRHLFFNLKKIFRIDLNKFFLTEGYRSFFFDSISYDIAHFFNEFSLSKRPWVSTFESKLPFLNDMQDLDNPRKRKFINKALNACASDSCKAIIAMSECARKLELNLLAHFPDVAPLIKRKMVCIFPPQKLYVHNLEEKKVDFNGKIRFLFVGREFYRKGGYDILRCFERLSQKFDFELIIVSLLKNINHQIFPKKIELETVKLINKYNGSWLTHFPELENEVLIRMMKECHVGLLPTYSDTFGYSVLEFQACGCPVITTDIRALPEINNQETGWLIDTGDKDYQWELPNPQKIFNNQIIENAIEKIAIQIIDNPSIIKAKAKKSIERIKKYHSPIDYREKIENIYHSALHTNQMT